MTTLIATVLTLVFFVLAGIHIYWAFGGKWASDAVLPTKDDHVKVLMPGIVPTLIVAFGLVSFGFIVLLAVVPVATPLPLWLGSIGKYGLWIITSIFTLRAIGDFTYVGFFKKIKHTQFGKNDTYYYSPLCLAISLLAFYLVFASR